MIKTTGLYYLIILFTIQSLSSFINGQSFLRTSGKKIVNESGQEVILEGFGLGGWLLMEGYMLHTSGFANAQWEIKEKIENLIGQTNAETFYQAYHENYVRKTDVDEIAAWGFNSIRLPMHYNILTPPDSPGVYLNSGFAIFDSVNITLPNPVGSSICCASKTSI